MSNLVNFSDCKLSNRNLQYGGRAGEKKGIIYNGEYWFLKFPKNTIGMNNVEGIDYVTSPLSEYIGSRIFAMLGFDVHKTELGICFDGKRNKVVCGCKDFINDDKNELLIQYTSLRNDTDPKIMEKFDKTMKSATNFNEILFHLDNNTILKTIPKLKEDFFDRLVVDLIINNNDRNEDNWGVIKYKSENKYKLAPVFDCGNCFYGKASDERIRKILSEKDRLISSSLDIITVYENNDGNNITFRDMVKYNNQYLKKSFEKILKLFNSKMKDIEKFISTIPESFEDVDIISDVRKEYYIKTMKYRLETIRDSLK